MPRPALTFIVPALLAWSVATGAPPAGPPAAATKAPECPMHGGMHGMDKDGGGNCATAHAGGCPMMHGRGMGGPDGMMGGLDGLQLSAAQRESMKAIGERFSARGTALRQRGEALAEAMQAAEPGTPGYAAAMDKAGVDAAALAADAVRLGADLRAEIHAILTPEQRAQLRQRAADRRKGWDEWRERHRPAAK